MVKCKVGLILIVILILSVYIVNANSIKVNSKNDFVYNSVQEYSYIEHKKDLHSYIGIEIKINNLTKDPNKNLTLFVSPVNQAKHVDSRDIELINVSFCKGGRMYRQDYQISLNFCNPLKEITKDYSSYDYNLTSRFGNYTHKGFRYTIPSSEIDENEYYSFKVEYIIRDFIVRQEDDYTFIEVDDLPEGIDKTIILPKGALLKTLPEKSLPIIAEDKRWLIHVSEKSRSNEWYFITYEIVSWYRGLWGYLLAFLGGGILVSGVTYLLNNYSLKKYKLDIISKLRSSMQYYLKRKIK